MLTFDINMDSLNAQLDQIATKAQKAARIGAKAGAAVYYDAVKATTPVSEHGHWFHGTSFKKSGTKYWFESGSLKNAVYQAYRKESTLNSPMYQIAWNHRKVPYGFMVVGGTKKGAKANDFIGKAKSSVASQANAEMLFQFELVMSK